MEDRTVLNWKLWSRLRKVQALSAVVGAAGTAAFFLLARLFDGGGGAQGYLSFSGAVQLLICWPTIKLFSLLGKKFILSDNEGQGPGYDLLALILVILINGLLLTTLATLIVWLAKQCKKQIAS